MNFSALAPLFQSFVTVSFTLALPLMPILGSLAASPALRNIAAAMTGMAFFLALISLAGLLVRTTFRMAPSEVSPCGLLVLKVAAFVATAAAGMWALCVLWGCIVVIDLLRAGEDYTARERRAEMERQSLSEKHVPTHKVHATATATATGGHHLN